MPETATLHEERQSAVDHPLAQSPGGPYTIRHIAFTRLSTAEFTEWMKLRGRVESSPYSHPDWMRGYFDEAQLDNLTVFMLYRDGRLEGVAPFLRLRWPLKCHLGPFQVACFPLVRLRLIGETPDFPDDEDAYRALLGHLASFLNADTIFLEGVPVQSALWRCVSRAEIDTRFRRYAPTEPTPRCSIRVSGTFDAYLKGFSTRHRYNLRRRVTKFQEESPAPVSWKRYTSPEEVDVFLNHALTVSRNTYQWKLFERGLSDTQRMRRRLLFAAENGWLRSYLLFAGETPVAFVVGWQHHACFEHHEIGYDPAWRQWAVGTVLHMHMIKDLFEHAAPKLLDFGAHGPYKEELANESHLEGNAFLFRRRSVYLFLARHCHAACRTVTSKVSVFLRQRGLESAVRRLIKN